MILIITHDIYTILCRKKLHSNAIVHSNEEYAPQKDGTLKSCSEAEGDYADVISSMSEGVNVGIHKDYDGTEEQRAGQHDLPLMLYV